MKQWYVGYFYHGYLKQLKAAMENPKHNETFKDVKMWYPMITLVSAKDGKKEIKKEPVFDNYMLFQFEEESLVWVEIKRFTPILKFISGKRNDPIPLLSEEVMNLKELEANTIFESYSHLINQEINVTGGPYKGLVGHCKSIIKGKHMARVSINLFDVVEREVEINLEHLKLTK
jgi:transcription antitermination factor NusG